MKQAVLGILLFASLLAAAQPEYVANFGEVNDKLWRGGQPSSEALRELKDLGVSIIVDLREHSDAEKAEAEKLGLRYRNIPLRPLGAPRQAEVEAALGLILHEADAKIFIHCWRGKDRTGTIVACYRVQHDGWDNRRALDEAKSYGMSRLERAMQSYILHFTPITLSGLLSPAQ